MSLSWSTGMDEDATALAPGSAPEALASVPEAAAEMAPSLAGESGAPLIADGDPPAAMDQGLPEAAMDEEDYVADAGWAEEEGGKGETVDEAAGGRPPDADDPGDDFEDEDDGGEAEPKRLPSAGLMESKLPEVPPDPAEEGEVADEAVEVGDDNDDHDLATLQKPPLAPEAPSAEPQAGAAEDAPPAPDKEATPAVSVKRPRHPAHESLRVQRLRRMRKRGLPRRSLKPFRPRKRVIRPNTEGHESMRIARIRRMARRPLPPLPEDLLPEVTEPCSQTGPMAECCGCCIYHERICLGDLWLHTPACLIPLVQDPEEIRRQVLATRLRRARIWPLALVYLIEVLPLCAGGGKGKRTPNVQALLHAHHALQYPEASSLHLALTKADPLHRARLRRLKARFRRTSDRDQAAPPPIHHGPGSVGLDSGSSIATTPTASVATEAPSLATAAPHDPPPQEPTAPAPASTGHADAPPVSVAEVVTLPYPGVLFKKTSEGPMPVFHPFPEQDSAQEPLSVLSHLLTATTLRKVQERLRGYCDGRDLARISSLVAASAHKRWALLKARVRHLIYVNIAEDVRALPLAARLNGFLTPEDLRALACASRATRRLVTNLDRLSGLATAVRA
jgi:hypothetical protein